jgi:hypothetical protein
VESGKHRDSLEITDLRRFLRLHGMQEVRGSSPLSSTLSPMIRRSDRCGWRCQRVTAQLAGATSMIGTSSGWRHPIKPRCSGANPPLTAQDVLLQSW